MKQHRNALKPGTKVEGLSHVYTIDHVLGSGAFGITYLATTETVIQGELGEICTTVNIALKEFYMDGRMKRNGCRVVRNPADDELAACARCFYMEANKLSMLSHPHIIKVLEVFVQNGTCYYAMEYLSGGSINDYIMHTGGIPETEALGYIRQAGDALSYMHGMKMVHFDIKPSNMMFDDNRQVKIIDFGLTQLYESNGESESDDGLFPGTQGYAPMEQASKNKAKLFAPTFDIYALGATFYKMLTAVTPPPAIEVLNSGLKTLPLVTKNVSQQSIDAIRAAMQPMADVRLHNVADFIAMLPEAEVDSRNSKAKLRRRWKYALAAIVAVLLMLAAVYTFAE